MNKGFRKGWSRFDTKYYCKREGEWFLKTLAVIRPTGAYCPSCGWIARTKPFNKKHNPDRWQGNRI